MKKLLLAVLAGMMMTSGCASRQELSDNAIQERNAGKQGVTRVYPIPAEQAWEITEAVFRWEQTDEVEKHGTEHYVITSTGMKMLAFGSVMAVWIEPADSATTKVTVVTKRRVEDDIFTALNESTFFERFEQGMKILKAGKKLPVVAPAH
ncbi:hypothetical protein EG829_02530 [bacterium]|nr:hypothetical protein [bacterium]